MKTVSGLMIVNKHSIAYVMKDKRGRYIVKASKSGKPSKVYLK